MLFLLEENHQWQVQPSLDEDHEAETPPRSNIQLKEKQPISSISNVITYRLCPCDIKLMLYDEVTRRWSWGTQDAGGRTVLRSCSCQGGLGAAISHPSLGPCTTEVGEHSELLLYKCQAGTLPQLAAGEGEGCFLGTGRSWQLCWGIAVQG